MKQERVMRLQGMFLYLVENVLSFSFIYRRKSNTMILLPRKELNLKRLWLNLSGERYLIFILESSLRSIFIYLVIFSFSFDSIVLFKENGEESEESEDEYK